MKDDMVAIGTEFTNVASEVAGQQCTDPNLINSDLACAYYYGPNYVSSGDTQDVFVKGNTKAEDGYQDYSVEEDKCTGLFKRNKCKKICELSDMKNAICLWTNRSCGGKTAQQRVDDLNNSNINLNGGKWVALNPNNICGTDRISPSNMCLICTTGGLTKKYLDTGNPYYAAISDTIGKVGGQNAGQWEFDYNAAKPVGSKDLYICRYAAYYEHRIKDSECSSTVTDNLKDVYGTNDKLVYIPPGSDMDLMNGYLQKYKNMGPDAAFFDNSSNYTWTDTYKKTWCWDYDVQNKDGLKKIQGADENWYEIKSCIGETGTCYNRYGLKEGNETHFDLSQWKTVTNCRQ
jgi:hypothetical protein